MKLGNSYPDYRVSLEFGHPLVAIFRFYPAVDTDVPYLLLLNKLLNSVHHCHVVGKHQKFSPRVAQCLYKIADSIDFRLS